MISSKNIAELYSLVSQVCNGTKTVEAFKTDPIVNGIAKDVEGLKPYEEMGCFPVRMLICLMNELQIGEWSEKYKYVKRVYQAEDRIWEILLLQDELDTDTFESKVLGLLDERTLELIKTEFQERKRLYSEDALQLKKINAQIEEMQITQREEREKKKAEREQSDKEESTDSAEQSGNQDEDGSSNQEEENTSEINEDDAVIDSIDPEHKDKEEKKSKKKKKKKNSTSVDKKLAERRKEKSELETKLSGMETIVEKLRKMNTPTQYYLNESKEEEIKTRVFAFAKQQAAQQQTPPQMARVENDGFAPVNSVVTERRSLFGLGGPSKEERILDSLVDKEWNGNSCKDNFADKDFCNRFVAVLDKQENPYEYVKGVILLHQQLIIDINGPVTCFRDYLRNHSDALERYVINNFATLYSNGEGDYLGILDVAIGKELQIYQEGERSCFAKLWNCIDNEELWNEIIEIIEQKCGGELDDGILAFMSSGLEGKSVKVFIEVLQKRNIPLNRIVKYQLTHFPSADLISTICSRLEMTLNKTQKRLNTAERKLGDQSSLVFSSLYESLERIEMLAVNVKTSNPPIDNSLVAKELIENIIELRRSMESNLGVGTATDYDVWRKQTPIEFDSKKHRKDSMTSAGGMVTLNTLGFTYEEDGEEFVHHARVADNSMKGEGEEA